MFGSCFPMAAAAGMRFRRLLNPLSLPSRLPFGTDRTWVPERDLRMGSDSQLGELPDAYLKWVVHTPREGKMSVWADRSRVEELLERQRTLRIDKVEIGEVLPWVASANLGVPTQRSLSVGVSASEVCTCALRKEDCGQGCLKR
eukprot:c51879_g1_i1 orf=29-460(+)